MTGSKWFYPKGELAAGPWDVVVDQSIAGWEHSGLRVATIAAGESLALDEPGIERLIVPLAGSFAVDHADATTKLEGRSSVFAGPTDVLYASSGVAVTISGEGRVAIAEAPTDVVHPVQYIAKADVPVELRGSGKCSRQVHNFGLPGVLEASKLIVCELITPSENWSTYPAHKHDQNVPGHESALEEIYYFEAQVTRDAKAPDNAEPFAMFSTYSSPAGEIEINASVKDGDVVLVPFGYHGPLVAAPGYDNYYFNVMAGPDPDRAWHINDDPNQAWVREYWEQQPMDPRLPYTDSLKGS